MRYYHLYILSLLVFLPCTMNAQKKWTLDECVGYAISHNTDIHHRIIEQKVRENDLDNSNHARLPEVDAKVDQLFSFGTNISTGTRVTSDLSYSAVSLNASMPLFTGFRIPNQIKAGKFSLMSAAENLNAARQDLRLQIAASYLQALYYKGQVRISEHKTDVSKQFVDKATELFSSGKRPKSELAEAEATLSSDQYALTEARSNAKLACITLAQMLNLTDVESFEIEDPDTTSVFAPLAEPQVLFNDIVENYPTILASKYNIESTRYGIEVAKSAYWPELSLTGSISDYYYNTFHESVPSFGYQLKDNDNYVIGLSLKVPIFNGFKTRNSIRKAKLAYEDAQVTLDDSRLKLQKEIQQAYYNAITARDKFEAANKAEASNALSYAYENEKYDSGRSTVYDLNQSRQKWFSAQEDALRSRYEYLIRMKILDFYKNRMQ
jgi:outer membrane protein